MESESKNSEAAISLMDDLVCNVLRLMKEKGLNEEALAKSVGLSTPQIFGIEKRQTVISLNMLERLAEALDVAPRELLHERSCSLRVQVKPGLY